MASPKAEGGERAPYQTVNRRLEAWTERIRERYNRAPTTYELLAIDHFPCLPSTQLFDRSRSGIIIYERLRYAEETGNPMLLEEAGRLLMLQMTNAWTPAKSINEDVESRYDGFGNDVGDAIGRLNHVLLHRYQNRQKDTLELENQQAPCNIPFAAGVGQQWNKTTTGGCVPSSNRNNNTSIHWGNGSTAPFPSRAIHQNAFLDVFSSPPAFSRPVPTASLNTGGSPCPTPSTTTSTSSPYLHPANIHQRTTPTSTNPVLQAHSINGNTYIIPITLHFSSPVSNSSISVHIPSMASATYPLDLVSGPQQQTGTAKDVRPSKGATNEIGTKHGAGTGYASVRNAEHGEVRVEVRVGEGGEPIGAARSEWVAQGQGWESRK